MAIGERLPCLSFGNPVLLSSSPADEMFAQVSGSAIMSVFQLSFVNHFFQNVLIFSAKVRAAGSASTCWAA